MATIPIKRGDDKVYRWTFLDDNDAIRSLSDWTILFTVKVKSPDSSTDDLDDASAKIRYWWKHDAETDTVITSRGLSLPAGKTPGDGQLIIDFPYDLTTTLPIVSGWKYDIQGKTPGNRIQTLDEGTFKVEADTTRATDVWEIEP